MVDAEEPKAERVFKKNTDGCALCTCDIPVKISYRDVLILEQFMRVDGTVLPKQLTGLCTKQQRRVERCVMQAHWAGLFPDRTDPALDRAGYRRFNRYWEDDLDMFRRKVVEEPGSWFYIKRYNAKKGEFAKPVAVSKVKLGQSALRTALCGTGDFRMLRRVFLLVLLNAPFLFASTCDPDDVQCQLKADPRDVQLIRVRSGEDAHLPCNARTDSTTKLEWWVARRREVVARWPDDARPTATNETSESPYAVDANGTLTIRSAHRGLVEEYECAVYNGATHEKSSFVLAPFFSTVFWGSCLVSLLASIATFILNLLWIVVRKVSLWWINRSERISRVRNMVEAMEKYRQRQIEHLHENYQKRVAAIRDNYHQQARVETMTQHLDNIRDNYNQQLTRIREYGSRRAERLVESYERQLNRMRTFTLQHRLKLMRQYKVKQQYINRLLDTIAASNNEQTIQENEQKIRELFDLPEPDHNLPLGTEARELTRSASYYSLPEFTNDEYETHIQRGSQRRRFPAVNFADSERRTRRWTRSNRRPSTTGRSPRSPRRRADFSSRLIERVDETNSSTPLLEPRRPTSMIEKTTIKDEEKPKSS
ncbi:Protein CBR-MRPS-18A [Aphelenchoides fujianensis]|nr:Protein CBR-MRPS-18A [Aphelenchoides fujianensis]